jgi:4-hydroxy-4-methyl-2-oxoglutarate aldolase
MIGAPPVLTLRSNFARPSPAQVSAFAGVPTGFVVDAMNGLGRGADRVRADAHSRLSGRLGSAIPW